MLTAGAGLLITSFSNLRHANQGFNPDNLLTLTFETPDPRYKTTRPQFYREYFDKLRSLPGVQSAGGVMVLPMTNDSIDISFENPEHPVPKGGQPAADFAPVSTQYFSTMQIPLLSGRDFTERDDATGPQVLCAGIREGVFREQVLGKKPPGAGGKRAAVAQIVGAVGKARLGMTQREMRSGDVCSRQIKETRCCLHSIVRSTPIHQNG